MKDLLLPLLHLAVTAGKLCRPGGVRAVIAENLLLKQQLIVLRRSRQRAPNLRVGDRLLCGFGALFLSPGRIRKVAIGLRPSTLLTFHQALVRGKYRRLFSSSARPKKPGPKGPSESLIRAIVELKSRNPRFGCPRIARIISQTFGVDIDKNVVHRVLAKRYRPAPGGTGPSWLSFVGHTTDSLWSVDLLRCASIVLQSDWVLVVMDQFTRRLVGFGVHRGPVDAPSLCRMCNAAIHGRGAPRHLSTDHDPLFEAHRWTANLRLLEIDEIKTVPHVPLSHPFVERLIGTMRRECLDHVLCWNAGDLERKLADFQAYYNAARSHASLEGYTPLDFAGERTAARAEFNHVRWILPLPGHGPASSGGLMTNSRPTGFAPVGRRTKFHDVTASSLPFDQPCLVAPCTNACAGKARSRGTRCRDVIFETLFDTLWVSNPIRPRSAASRNRVMRGPGVTPGAKRSQGARRPRD